MERWRVESAWKKQLVRKGRGCSMLCQFPWLQRRGCPKVKDEVVLFYVIALIDR